MQKDYKVVPYFGSDCAPINPESVEVAEFNRKLHEIGSCLHFTIARHDEGWYGRCDEYPQIFGGGNEVNPSDEIIAKKLREAVLNTFDIDTYNPREKFKKLFNEQEGGIVINSK